MTATIMEQTTGNCLREGRIFMVLATYRKYLAHPRITHQAAGGSRADYNKVMALGFKPLDSVLSGFAIRLVDVFFSLLWHNSQSSLNLKRLFLISQLDRYIIFLL